MADQNKNNQGDPLLFNKIAGAGLAAILLAVGLPQLASALMGGGHHGASDELHLAYCCVELDFASHGGGEEEAPFDLGAALAAADPASGQRRSAICASCHTFEKGGANGTGPNLWNLVGRDVASVSGYGYTAALQAAGGQWTYDRLDAYLKNSQEYIPGTAMVQRFPQDDRRADILAYLATLSDNPVPFPAPAVVHAEADAHMEDAAGMVEEAAGHGEDAAGAVVDAAHDVSDAVEDAADAVEDVDHE